VKVLRPPGRLPAALALSAALHAGLVAWLATREPAARPAEERIEVRLVEVEAPVVEAPVAMVTPASKPRATARRTATSTPPPTSPPNSTPTSPPNSTPTATATPAGGATPLPGSPEWLASRGLEPAEGKGVSLALPWRGGGAGGEGEGTSSASERLPGEPPEVVAKRNVDGWLRDLAALERARHPDGYWSGVRKRLEGGFSPGWEVLTGTRQDQGLLSRGQLRALAEAWKGYQEQAARYGATGSLYGAEPGVPGSGPEPGRRDAQPPPSLFGDVLHQIFHRELTALVRIRQEPDGKVAAVKLLRSSGNAAYDRVAMARAGVLRAEEEPPLGPTPPQGRETLWAFVTRFDMVPPVPVLGLSFDAWFVPTDVTYPLKKSARSDVELKAVY